jgi:hypothetical protein
MREVIEDNLIRVNVDEIYDIIDSMIAVMD